MKREQLLKMIEQLPGVQKGEDGRLQVRTDVRLTVLVVTGSAVRAVPRVVSLELLPDFVRIQAGRVLHLYPYEAIMGLEVEEDKPSALAGFIR